MKRKAKSAIVFYLAADVRRDRVEVRVPHPLTKKDFDGLQIAVSRAAWKALTSRRRRTKAT